jgi:transposase
MRTRRTFAREFKREAACLVLDHGYSVRDVCTQLDLQEGALRGRVHQVRFERNGGVPETAALTPEQQEIQALKARINELEREKTVLKKAAAPLVAEEIDRSL